MFLTGLCIGIVMGFSLQPPGDIVRGERNSDAQVETVAGKSVIEVEGERTDVESVAMDRSEMKTLVGRLGSGTVSEGLLVTARAIENLRSNNVEGAIQALLEAKAQGKDLGLTERGILEKIGEIDGRQQLDNRLPEHPDDPPGWGVDFLLQGWANAMPDRAKEWFSNLPDGRYKNELAYSAVVGIARKQPLAAVDFLLSLPIETQFASPSNMAFAVVQNGGSSAADKWIHHLEMESDPESAQRAFNFVFDRMTIDYGNAAEWLDGETASKYFGDSKKVSFAAGWAQNAPSEAAEWAMDSGNQELLSTVISSSDESQFNQLGAWLSSHREADFFKNAARVFANRIEATDPEAAEKWRDIAGDNESK